jgi:flagellar protein FlaG
MIDQVAGQTNIPAYDQQRSATTAAAGSGTPRRAEEVQPAAHVATIDPDVLQRTVVQLREAVRNVNPHLQMEIDADLDRVVVKVLDGQSGEVIRQIPAEEVLALAKDLLNASGLLVRKQA